MSPALLMDFKKPGYRELSGSQYSRSAPSYVVPSQQIVSVEHPYIINDVSKALQTLGGVSNAEQLVEKDDVRATLYMHREDPMSKPLNSTNVFTQNVVLRVIVPKRTGRRRKRGSQDPFHEMEEPSTERPGRPRLTDSTRKSRDAGSLLKTLRDNPDKYEIHPVGVIEQTHRFRGLPDYVFSTVDNKFVQRIRKNFLPLDYDTLKDFQLDMSKGVKKDEELIPPPQVTHLDIPYNYQYKQNQSMKHAVDADGNLTIVNSQKARKVWTQIVFPDIPDVPNEPAPGVIPLNTIDAKAQQFVERVNEVLERRPIWTRRALANQLNPADWTHWSKTVLQYVSYMFRSGPWRDCIVKFGVDPRSDPKYRIYQSIMYQLDGDGKHVKRLRANANTGRRGGSVAGRPRKLTPFGHKSSPLGNKSHIFDGKSVGTDGKVWQVCDITDPLMMSVFSTTNLRQKCDVRSDGWFLTGTWAKARVMLKAKMTPILHSKPPLDDMEFARFLQLPDKLTPKALARSVLGKHNKPTKLEVEVFSNYRMVGRRSMDSNKAQKRLMGEELSDVEEADGDEPLLNFDGEVIESIEDVDEDTNLDDEGDVDDDEEDGPDSGESEEGGGSDVDEMDED